MSQRAVFIILERRLLEQVSGAERPWLEQIDSGPFMDDQMIARVLAHADIYPTQWSECRSAWRSEVINDPVWYAIVHPRYYH